MQNGNTLTDQQQEQHGRGGWYLPEGDKRVEEGSGGGQRESGGGMANPTTRFSILKGKVRFATEAVRLSMISIICSSRMP